MESNYPEMAKGRFEMTPRLSDAEIAWVSDRKRPRPNLFLLALVLGIALVFGLAEFVNG